MAGTNAGTLGGTRFQGRTGPDLRKPIDAEDLVRWAYGKERVGRCDPGPTREIRQLSADYGESGDGMGLIERYVSLGTLISPPTKGSVELVHVDARAVDDLVQDLEPLRRELVKRHGRAMGRPGWGDEIKPLRALPRMVLARKGIHREPYVVTYDENRNAVAPYCPFEWVDSSDLIEAARARYSLWWEALDGLARSLVANPWTLTGWRVTGFGAPQCPWHKD